MKEKDDKEEKSGMQDRVRIKGYVNVYQHEDGEDFRDGKQIVDSQENKFVDSALKWFRDLLVIRTIYTNNQYYGYYWFKMVLGTDTTTNTTAGMSSISTPIGAGDGTAQDTYSISGFNEPSTDVFEIRYTATWYSGSVSGTVGEIGFYYGTFDSSITFEEMNTEQTEDANLTNRLSVADNEFSSFSIDTSKSLTVEWIFRYTFA